MNINYFPFINDPNPKKIRKDIIKSPAKFLKSKLTGSRDPPAIHTPRFPTHSPAGCVPFGILPTEKRYQN